MIVYLYAVYLCVSVCNGEYIKRRKILTENRIVLDTAISNKNTIQARDINNLTHIAYKRTLDI